MRSRLILFIFLSSGWLFAQNRFEEKHFMSSVNFSFGSYQFIGDGSLEARMGFLSKGRFAIGLQSVYTLPPREAQDLSLLMLGPYFTYYVNWNIFKPFIGAEVSYGDFIGDLSKYSDQFNYGLLRYGPSAGFNLFLLPQLALEASIKYQFFAYEGSSFSSPHPVEDNFTTQVGISFFY